MPTGGAGARHLGHLHDPARGGDLEGLPAGASGDDLEGLHPALAGVDYLPPSAHRVLDLVVLVDLDAVFLGARGDRRC